MTPAQAADLLRRGQLVAIPTETVYGLAAEATREEAIRQVFALKGRPADHPLIVHLGDTAWAAHWGVLPPLFGRLAERFWPGPLTMVVPRLARVSPLITGGQDSVALRVPRHPLTLETLLALGEPVVAPSANRFGHTSPTRAEHVLAEFPGLPVLDGGPCPVGLESSIIDLTGPQPRLLRPGQLSRALLEEVTGPLALSSADAPRVPGALERHYAPRTLTRWDDGQIPTGRWGWLGFSGRGATFEVLMPSSVEDYGARLYAALRELDAAGLEVILVERPPQSPEWEAVLDRLRRATA
ncbi:MAG: threonylcarbamoyl-AMP synthase [Candidatus Eremiobacteraeota bacterium]|nr:threonylcarbamoyl-AMP synthase [Candidatus Eremiobacteraeota bacterium]MCW5869626.1 threonylcarbamoyl-AMP synthase [Candidatus Eremiobacteraeota bacterium]